MCGSWYFPMFLLRDGAGGAMCLPTYVVEEIHTGP